MKNIILILLCTFLGAITLMLIMTMYGRINRNVELKSNVSSAIEATLENVKVKQKYEIRNRNEFVADFVESFVYTIDAKSDIQVDVFQCDKEKGNLAVSVALFYKHPNGKMGIVQTEKNVIFNRNSIDSPLERYKVKFWVGTECYKIFEVCKGSVISVPVPPDSEEKTFVGWLNADGTIADLNNPVIEDVTYYADIR